MKRSEILLLLLQIPMDFFMLLLAGISAYTLRFSAWVVDIRPVIFHITLPEYFSIVVAVSLVWLVIFAFAGLYTLDPNRKLLQELTGVLTATLSGLALVAVYVMFTQEVFDSRFLVAASWFFALVYVSAGRLAMRGLRGILYRFGIGARRVAIVGGHSAADMIAATLRSRPELGYAVVGHFSAVNAKTFGALDTLKPDEIIFTNPRANEAQTLTMIDFCNDRHIVFKYSADLFDTYSTNMSVYPLAGVPVVELKPTPLDGWGRVVKRLFDVVMSCIMIVVFFPLMLLTACIILCETGRPVIYKNERIGLRGKKFFIYKFRSMHQKDSTGEQFGASGRAALERESALIEERNTRNGPIYKIGNDPRVTPFGRFIRRWSIDEMPQFFNVLAGTMSIVGPRPHQPREVARYERPHRVALVLKPGITGLAQISGRSDLQYEDEMKLDVFYIEHWSALLDVVIFLKTPFVIFKKRKVV